MVNEDILGGIEVGVAKGEAIESIMMGFYNSGYSKEDIEWAAKAFQMNKFRPLSLGFPQKKGLVPFTSKKDPNTPQKPEELSYAKKPYVKQHVSHYGQPSELKEKVILFILIASLILLLGVLAGVFLFKERIVEIINNLFIG